MVKIKNVINNLEISLNYLESFLNLEISLYCLHEELKNILNFVTNLEIIFTLFSEEDKMRAMHVALAGNGGIAVEDMPSYLMLLSIAHEYLGRYAWLHFSNHL